MEDFTYTPGPHAKFYFTFTVLSMIVVLAALALRAWVRICIVKAFGPDDWLMLIAVLCFIWMASAMCADMCFGFGRHIIEVPLPVLIPAFKTYMVAQIGYTFTVMFLKLSVCWFYLRITTIRWQLLVVRVLIAVNALYSFAAVIVIINQCSPISYLWTQFTGAKGLCLPVYVLQDISYAFGALSVATEWILSTMPIFLIAKLQMDCRLKLFVLVILGLGYFASIASILRLTHLGALTRSEDYTYTVMPIAFWSVIENLVGIVAANLATYRPLFASRLESLSRSTGIVGKVINWTSQRVFAGSNKVSSKHNLSLSHLPQPERQESCTKGIFQHSVIDSDAESGRAIITHAAEGGTAA